MLDAGGVVGDGQLVALVEVAERADAVVAHLRLNERQLRQHMRAIARIARHQLERQQIMQVRLLRRGELAVVEVALVQERAPHHVRLGLAAQRRRRATQRRDGVVDRFFARDPAQRRQLARQEVGAHELGDGRAGVTGALGVVRPQLVGGGALLHAHVDVADVRLERSGGVGDGAEGVARGVEVPLAEAALGAREHDALEEPLGARALLRAARHVVDVELRQRFDQLLRFEPRGGAGRRRG